MKVSDTRIIETIIPMAVYKYFEILTYADLRVFSCHSFTFVFKGSSHIVPSQPTPAMASPPFPHHHENESATYPLSYASKDAAAAS